MAIQIIIDGNHATDIAAEIMTLATMLNGNMINPLQNDEEPNHHIASYANDTIKSTYHKEALDQSNQKSQSEDNDVQNKIPKVKVGPRQHKRFADEMIASGEIDIVVYQQLNKTQKTRVDEALSKIDKSDEKIEPEATGLADSVESIHAGPAEDGAAMRAAALKATDETVTSFPVPTIDELRKLISEKGRDSVTGADVPAAFAVISQILREAIPAELDIKAGNIPQDKLGHVYDKISVL